jgi:signal transduction histidine kinase
LDRQAVELSALAFQALVTLLLALVYLGLWRHQRHLYFASWAAGWGLYAVRLGCISAFIVTRREFWLFLHQATTGLMALVLLLAALQFARGIRWRRRYAWLGLAAIAGAYFVIYHVRDLMVAGISAAVLLSAVTLWTAVVFWQHRRRVPSIGATVLATTFTLWGIHHLDYPLLRPLGSAVLLGVFADVLFIMATAVGALFLMLSHDRQTLETRSTQLEQLTRLLLKAQEDERRKVARELHDEAGQILTAVKIDLDLAGRAEASEMVGRALSQVRDLSNLLRPSALDELGLLPALRSLVEDFGRRTHIQTSLRMASDLQIPSPDEEVIIYRVVQEALTNVARHAGASAVCVNLETEGDRIRLVIQDDGRGPASGMTPHLGLLGMRERVTAIGGTLVFGAAYGKGFRLEISIPARAPA